MSDRIFHHAAIAPPTFFKDVDGTLTPSAQPGMWLTNGGKFGVYVPGVMSVQFDSAGHVVQFDTETDIYKKVTP